jgi:DNA-binding response OmpR family regulator
LEPQGYKIVTAVDGQAALEEFARNQPDLVLLDIMMPRVDGVEVCRRLKKSPESRLTPIVLVTALSAKEDRVRGIEAGADDFLNKPLDGIELLPAFAPCSILRPTPTNWNGPNQSFSR